MRHAVRIENNRAFIFGKTQGFGQLLKRDINRASKVEGVEFSSGPHIHNKQVWLCSHEAVRKFFGLDVVQRLVHAPEEAFFGIRRRRCDSLSGR